MTQVKTTKLDWIRDAVTVKYVEEEYTVQRLQGWLKDTYGLHAALGTGSFAPSKRPVLLTPFYDFENNFALVK